jgi:hypothetical protein
VPSLKILLKTVCLDASKDVSSLVLYFKRMRDQGRALFVFQPFVCEDTSFSRRRKSTQMRVSEIRGTGY